jgi:dihydrofolate reductase
VPQTPSTGVVRKLIYSMTVSIDGFIADRHGEIDWTAPDEELHNFHRRQNAELGVHLLGRRLYQTMSVWDSDEAVGAQPEYVREFAPVWRNLPKIVFSTTLEEVGPNARLMRSGLAEEVLRLKREPGNDLAVGGAGLASSLIERGLIDEFRLFVRPVLLGGGTPYFPALDERVETELLETRTFGSRVVYLRYGLA